MENDEYFNENDRMLKEVYALIKSQNKVIAELKSELAEVRSKLDATHRKAELIYSTVGFTKGTIDNIDKRLQLDDDAIRHLPISWIRARLKDGL